MSDRLLSAECFSPYLMHDVDLESFNLSDAGCVQFIACRVRGRATGARRGEIAGRERRSSLGVVVFELSDRAQKRRLAENGKRQSAGEILFRLGLERRKRWESDARKIPTRQSTECHHSRRSRSAPRR